MADQQRPSATKRMLAMMPELAAWETPSGPCGATASVLSNHVSTDLRLFVDEATPRDEEHRSESPYEGPSSPAVGMGSAAMKAQISPDMDHLPVVQTTPRYMEAEKIGGSEVSYTHASPSVRLAGSRSVPHTPGHADSEEGASPSQERRAFTEPRAERATHRRGADGASLEDMLQKSLDRLAALESERATRFRQCREEAMKHGMKMVEEEQRRRDMEHTVMMRRIQLLSDELQETKHALAQKEEECDELLEAAQELSVHGNADAERKDRACIRILPSVMPGSPSKKKTGLAGFFHSLGGACSSK